MKMQLFATCSFGLEAPLAAQLRGLGFEDVQAQDACVWFVADEIGLCRANLWLRPADRVFLQVGRFPAKTFDELFEGTKALPWENYIGPADAFPVKGKSARSTLFSVSDCQSIVKKAIVERLKSHYHLEWFTETGPEIIVEVGLLKDTATLALDASGMGLHRRGYRTLNSPAPMRETLAAGLVLLSRWYTDRPFIDPMCGAGTLAIEAGMMAANRAPGLARSFAAEQWPFLPAGVFSRAREEATEALRPVQDHYIIANDASNQAISMAQKHARQAGVEGWIHFQQRSLADLESARSYGTLVCNPPYGERMGEKQAAEELYQQMGKSFSRLDSWSMHIITAHQGFERFYGRKADKKRKLYNGNMRCDLYQFYGPRPPKRQEVQP